MPTPGQIKWRERKAERERIAAEAVARRDSDAFRAMSERLHADINRRSPELTMFSMPTAVLRDYTLANMNWYNTDVRYYRRHSYESVDFSRTVGVGEALNSGPTAADVGPNGWMATDYLVSPLVGSIIVRCTACGFTVPCGCTVP